MMKPFKSPEAAEYLIASANLLAKFVSLLTYREL